MYRHRPDGEVGTETGGGLGAYGVVYGEVYTAE